MAINSRMARTGRVRFSGRNHSAAAWLPPQIRLDHTKGTEVTKSTKEKSHSVAFSSFFVLFVTSVHFVTPCAFRNGKIPSAKADPTGSRAVATKNSSPA